MNAITDAINFLSVKSLSWFSKIVFDKSDPPAKYMKKPASCFEIQKSGVIGYNRYNNTEIMKIVFIDNFK